MQGSDEIGPGGRGDASLALPRKTGEGKAAGFQDLRLLTWVGVGGSHPSALVRNLLADELPARGAGGWR
jgi:hypothetical protein